MMEETIWRHRSGRAKGSGVTNELADLYNKSSLARGKHTPKNVPIVGLHQPGGYQGKGLRFQGKKY